MRLSLSLFLVAYAACHVKAFAPASSLWTKKPALKSLVLHMAAEQPPPPTPTDLPVIRNQGNAPTPVRYSDFLKLVDADRIEKVTFAADGQQLLGVNTEGARLAIEALPNDPDLLTQLTNHKVDVTVLPAQEASGLGELAQSLLFPLALFAGLFFLSRRAGGMGPMGGPGNPMGFGKSKAQIQMIPDTGVTFDGK